MKAGFADYIKKLVFDYAAEVEELRNENERLTELLQSLYCMKCERRREMFEVDTCIDCGDSICGTCASNSYKTTTPIRIGYCYKCYIPNLTCHVCGIESEYVLVSKCQSCGKNSCRAHPCCETRNSIFISYVFR